MVYTQKSHNMKNGLYRERARRPGREKPLQAENEKLLFLEPRASTAL